MALASLALVAAGLAQGASKPTSVSLMTGTSGGAKFAGLVALQEVGAGQVRLAGLVTGLPAGKADLAIVDASDCAQPIGHERLRVHITPGTVFDMRGQLAGALGTGQALALLFGGLQAVRLRTPAGIRQGGSRDRAIVERLTDRALASRRRADAIGLVLLARSKPSAVTATASRSSCTGPAATAAATKLGRQRRLLLRRRHQQGALDVPPGALAAPLPRDRLREVGARTSTPDAPEQRGVERGAGSVRRVRILLVSQMYPGPADPDLGIVRRADGATRSRDRGHEIDLAVLDRRGGGKRRFLELRRKVQRAPRGPTSSGRTSSSRPG